MRKIINFANIIYAVHVAKWLRFYIIDFFAINDNIVW
jgi:hypothetical protein